jgi:hypothetical protein
MFLEANGQDFDNFKDFFYLPQKKGKVAPEKFKQGKQRDRFPEYATDPEESDWETVKRTSITWDKEVIENPYESRLGHRSFDWSGDIREMRASNRFLCIMCVEFDGQLTFNLVIKRGGWNPEDVSEWFDLAIQLCEPHIRENICRDNSTALSPEARLLLYRMTKEIWVPGLEQNTQRTSKLWEEVLYPTDLRDCTPLNCFWLMAGDLSFLFPFRQIKTPAFFRAYLLVRVTATT